MVALILSVVSCSGKTERQEPLYYYKAEFVDAGKKVKSVCPNVNTQLGSYFTVGYFNNAGVWCAKAVEEKDGVTSVNFLMYDYMTDQMTKKAFYVRNPDDGNKVRVISGEPVLLGITDDGKYVFLEKYLKKHYNGETIECNLKLEYPYNHWYLTTYDSDGIMTYSKLLYDIDGTIGDADTELTSNSALLSSDGTVYIFSQDYYSGGDSYVVAMTPTGEVKSSFRLKDVCPDYASGNITFNSVREDMNGNICVVFERFNPDDGYNHFEFCRYDDLANGNEYKPVKFRQDFGYGLLVAFSDKEAYFSTVYGLDRETVGENGYDQILNWLDVDISGCSDI